MYCTYINSIRSENKATIVVDEKQIVELSKYHDNFVSFFAPVYSIIIFFSPV